ncbi:MAG: hypothetical protein MRY57_03710 [Candidatus Pacebacteria bacterium]|nr:hypothetical protein [Candidatus Paceibacterota bacterium]
MKNYLEIAESYKPYYDGQEKYYHNFLHAIWTVIKGLDVMKSFGLSERLKVIYAHAMSLHDAGHSNGEFEHDIDNVKKALIIFERYCKLPKESVDWKMARTIILATAAPYEKYQSLEEIVYYSGVPEEEFTNLQLLIEIARDVDHIGIIGIQNKDKRNQALVGLMRELLKRHSKKNLTGFIEQGTKHFFDGIHFYTDYMKEWAEENLEEAKKWQLDFSKEAIELASK